MCASTSGSNIVEQNGVVIEQNVFGFYERARDTTNTEWYTPDDREFYALVAQFNGQTYFGTAW